MTGADAKDANMNDTQMKTTVATGDADKGKRFARTGALLMGAVVFVMHRHPRCPRSQPQLSLIHI